MPNELRAIADVVDKFAIPTVKVTGGQRIDMLGIKKEDLPAVWADLGKAGFVSGHAYAKGLRTVKTCVGTDWCRFGTQDSTGLGIRIEKFMWGSWTPAKVKMAVSGCPRNCAEATCKDVGVVCVDSGFEIHFAGAAGLDIKGTEVLGLVPTEDEALEVIVAWCRCTASRRAIWSASTNGRSASASRRSAARCSKTACAAGRFFDRFVFSQKFAQVDPWSERVSGLHKHEFRPLAAGGMARARRSEAGMNWIAIGNALRHSRARARAASRHRRAKSRCSAPRTTGSSPSRTIVRTRAVRSARASCTARP